MYIYKVWHRDWYAAKIVLAPDAASAVELVAAITGDGMSYRYRTAVIGAVTTDQPAGCIGTGPLP